MAKDTGKTIAIIGILALVGYFLYKYLGGSSFAGGGGFWDSLPPNLPNAPITTPQEMHDKAGVTQRWTKVSYGDPGQPSLAFKRTTLAQSKTTKGVGTVSPIVSVLLPSKVVTIAKPLAVSKGVPVLTVRPTTINEQRTILAGAGLRANAPPRVVAKMKGGSWY